jgi:HEAT repeat protein
MNKSFVLPLLLVSAFPVLIGAQPIDSALQQLGSPEAEVRVAALRELQTSLDPRIPDAMLPLLSDEGTSIRRLAARAIGSRWWQIPEERVPAFVETLKRGSEDEQNMVRRAVGLVRRDYKGNMFAQSADQRWVIYERRGLPCLIDTTNGTEELLGWSYKPSAHSLTGNQFIADRPGWLISAWGDGPLTDAAYWHPKDAVVALLMLVNRKTSSVWIWRHKTPLRELEMTKILKALDYRESDMHFGGGFFMSIKGWRGDELRFDVRCSRRESEAFVDHTALMAWDSAGDTLRIISRQDGERY